jgi:hypothetical protein
MVATASMSQLRNASTHQPQLLFGILFTCVHSILIYPDHLSLVITLSFEHCFLHLTTI